MIRIIALLMCSLIASPPIAKADETPQTKKQLNIDCPSKELCPKMESLYQECKRDYSAPACLQFVMTFKQLLPVYDCSRSFDRNSTVPAAWLCDGQRGNKKAPYEFEDYVRLLSHLKSDEARRLLGSKEFRNVLDGAVAEEFGGKSLQIEKKLKRKRN